MVTVKLTPAEAAALREAASQVLAGEFDGTTRQCNALDRAAAKLSATKPAPALVVTVRCRGCGWVWVEKMVGAVTTCPNCSRGCMP